MTSAVSHDYLFEQTPFGTDTEQSYRTQFQSEEAVNGLGSIVRINLNSVQNGFINTHNSFLNLSFKTSFKGTNIVTGTGQGETPSQIIFVCRGSVLWLCLIKLI